MKKIIFTALIALGLVGFTGCMSGMMGGKCAGDSKCASSGKCGDSSKVESVDAVEDGDAENKCGE